MRDEELEELEKEFEGKMYGHLKGDVAAAVVDMLTPIQTRFHAIRDDQTYLNEVMKMGAEKASERAAKTLADVYKAVGFIPAR